MNTTSASVIIERVENAFGVPAEALRSRDQRAAVVLPRHVAMYLLRRYTLLTLQQIAEQLGRQHHVTAIYGCRRVQDLADVYPEFKRRIAEISDELAALACEEP